MNKHLSAKTKIIATLGPSSSTKRTIMQMVSNGMDCARINTAHGDFDQYLRLVKLVRQIDEIPIIIDIKGPEIRIRNDNEIIIKKNEKKLFHFNKSKKPHFNHDFSKSLLKGDKIFFDNGSVESSVSEINPDSVTLKFSTSCVIKLNKGVNVPGKNLKISPLSKKDKEAIAFALKHKLSFIALSFTRNKEDVLRVRKLLGDSGTGIIAKIENQQGIDNIDEIIDSSDGIMIARGDLGAEIAAEKLPELQKRIIEKCNLAGKLVIVATQMLESMINSATPTRAEVSDVANAVLDGADAVMLSGETASGKYPVISVETMNKIIYESEGKVESKVLDELNPSISSGISSRANSLAELAGATKIVCITRSGFSARLISRFRPKRQIIVVTDSHLVMKQLKLVWGVFPFLLKPLPKKALAPGIARLLVKKGILSKKDTVVFVGAVNTSIPQIANYIEIQDIRDLIKSK
jgi:pyruvate kinase